MKIENKYKPKQNNRFLVNFKDNFNRIPSFTTFSVNRPKLFEGVWEQITIELNDPIINKQNSEIIMDVISNSKDLSKIGISFDIELLDPTGIVVETWSINGEINVIDFGNLTMDDDSVTTIKLIITPKKVKLKTY